MAPTASRRCTQLFYRPLSWRWRLARRLSQHLPLSRPRSLSWRWRLARRLSQHLPLSRLRNLSWRWRLARRLSRPLPLSRPQSLSRRWRLARRLSRHLPLSHPRSLSWRGRLACHLPLSRPRSLSWRWRLERRLSRPLPLSRPQSLSRRWRLVRRLSWHLPLSRPQSRRWRLARRLSRHLPQSRPQSCSWCWRLSRHLLQIPGAPPCRPLFSRTDWKWKACCYWMIFVTLSSRRPNKRADYLETSTFDLFLYSPILTTNSEGEVVPKQGMWCYVAQHIAGFGTEWSTSSNSMFFIGLLKNLLLETIIMSDHSNKPWKTIRWYNNDNILASI